MFIRPVLVYETVTGTWVVQHFGLDPLNGYVVMQLASFVGIVGGYYGTTYFGSRGAIPQSVFQP